MVLPEHPTPTAIVPGQTIGVFGGGQLGRMLAMVARRSGYRVHVFTPEMESPAGAFANQVTRASYDDESSVKRFGDDVDVVTFEFENVQATAIDWLPPQIPVRPGKQILMTAQDRDAEKRFLQENGIPHPAFQSVRSRSELDSALQQVGCPSVLKTSSGGYDGKGQFRIDHVSQADQAWSAIGGQAATLEAFIDLEREVSVIVARDVFGESGVYGPIENRHVDHILDLSFVPSTLSVEAASEACAMAVQIAERLELVGLICVEFFVARDGRVLVNELAPRPHNSGHLTIEGAATSQFEQQLRCVCGLPLGSTRLIRPAAMVNLLGDLWLASELHWERVAEVPEAYLHLYDKGEPRAGRKMGHITACGPDAATAVSRAEQARSLIQKRNIPTQ